jgi:hypothetical protein
MPQNFALWRRVRVRDAHNFKGQAVSLSEDGYIAWVRFDRHPDTSFPYHVADLELEDDPCGCVFCCPKAAT